MMLVLVQAALHSLLLGVVTLLGLKLLRVKNPQVEITAWSIVLIAAVAMPLLMPLTRLTIPDAPPETLSPLASHARWDISLREFDWLWTDNFSGGAQPAPVSVERSDAASLVPRPSSIARGSQAAWQIAIEGIGWPGVATGFYLFVCGLLLLKLLVGLAILVRLARTARPIMVLPVGARVCASELVAVPVTFASVIMVPGDWETWSAVKRRAVLAHELSHVARGDFYTLLLASLYRIVFWFNPLSWWLLHQLGELMEMLSDDAAIADMGDAPAYAEVLLEVAASARSAPMAIAMARRSTVRRRIERILACTAPPPLSRRKRILISAGLVPLVALSAVTIARGTPPVDPKASVVAQDTPSGEPPPRGAVAAESSVSDRDSRIGIEADLTALKLDDILPGWVKLPGKASKAIFNLVPQLRSTRFEDIVIEGGGVSIKGSLEVDQNGDLITANFPIYSPSDGDKASLWAERGGDGVLKVTMRGDVFDGRGLLASAIAGNLGKVDDSKGTTKNIDFDVDLELSAVMGFNGEALRSVDGKLSRRNGVITNLALSGKIGRDAPVTAALRGRGQGEREVIYLQTKDAGAFLRFTDTYSRMSGGQLSLAMDPPTVGPGAKEGLIKIRDFTMKGEAAFDHLIVGGPAGTPNSVDFSRARAEFVRQNGRLTVREGVLAGPMIGGTIEGTIDDPGNQVRMSGTLVPLYRLPDMSGRARLGRLLGADSNESLIGVTYEITGAPGKPVVHVNPVPVIAPGVWRRIFRFQIAE
jgi:hypothetical protein